MTATTSSNADYATENSTIRAIQIVTPDHQYGWVIIIDGETTVRVAISGTNILERQIAGAEASLDAEAWDMVIRTLNLTGPRDEYSIKAVDTTIPRTLAAQVIAAKDDMDQNEVINELAVYIGKQIAQ